MRAEGGVSRCRAVLAVICFAGATILVAHAGLGQPELPFDFVLPQPPPERAAAEGDDTHLRLVEGPDVRRKLLERSRELRAVANAVTDRPERDRSIEIPELPSEAAARWLPEADSSADLRGEQ